MFCKFSIFGGMDSATLVYCIVVSDRRKNRKNYVKSISSLRRIINDTFNKSAGSSVYITEAGINWRK